MNTEYKHCIKLAKPSGNPCKKILEKTTIALSIGGCRGVWNKQFNFGMSDAIDWVIDLLDSNSIDCSEMQFSEDTLTCGNYTFKFRDDSYEQDSVLADFLSA